MEAFYPEGHGIPVQPTRLNRFAALNEISNALLAFVAAGCAGILWSALSGGVPIWGERALLGLAAGGALGLVLSGLRVWWRGRAALARNLAGARRILDEVARAGLATGSRASGLLMASDRAADAIAGFVADPASGRVAVVSGGAWSAAPASDIRIVQDSQWREMVLISTGERPDLEALVMRAALPSFLRS